MANRLVWFYHAVRYTLRKKLPFLDKNETYCKRRMLRTEEGSLALEEAILAGKPFMAGRIGLREVYGICLKENTASKRVLLKCGFEPVFEGTGEYQGEEREVFRSVRELP